jgi:hypothetical protein
MAEIARFRRKDEPEAPRHFSAAENQIWDRAIRSLRLVGTLSRVKRPALTRYVQRTLRSEALGAEFDDVGESVDRLRSLSRRLKGADRRVVEIAAAQLLNARVSIAHESARLGLAILRFLSAHRLTPMSRRRSE